MKNHEVLPNYYAVIPASVRYSPSLSSSEKLLYGEITALCGKEGHCWASNKYFARLYDCIPETVSTWVRHLHEQDFIEIEFRMEHIEIEGKSTPRTRRYMWITDKGGLMKNHKGGLMKNHKHNNTSNIISTSKEVEGGIKTPPFLSGNKFKRTSPSKKQPNILTTQEYINHWNSLGGVIIRHTNPNTATYKACIKLLKQLEEGTFIPKHTKIQTFLSSQHLPTHFNEKKWTREEILGVLDRLHKWAILTKHRVGLKEALYNPHHPTGLLSLFLLVSDDRKWMGIRRGKEQLEDNDPVRTEKFCKLVKVNGSALGRQEVIRHLQALREFRSSLPLEDKGVFAFGVDYHCPRTDPGKFLDHFGRWLEWQGSWLKNPSPGILHCKGGVFRKYLQEKWGRGEVGFKRKGLEEFL